uniref:Myosin-binding domain-containing protein n=1 Tax=Globisporangium ultimum (strain ATCC 200006 / CBS 805.95 / DAOM BR144) TaxID=431595 RepID=K3WDS1_GLOUD
MDIAVANASPLGRYLAARAEQLTAHWLIDALRFLDETLSTLVRASAAVGLGCILVLEMACQALLVFHRFKAHQLVATIRRYVELRQTFESSYQASLDIVKKAELASRGYRIGRILPPIGRIEKAANLRCGPMRIRLRTINEQVELISKQIHSREPVLVTEPEWRSDGETHSGNHNAPSLLISALAKRHELVHVLLENALRESLVESVASFWNLYDKAPDHKTFNLVNALQSQILQYENVSQAFATWNQELTQMKSSRGARLLQSTPAPTNEDENAKSIQRNRDADVECVNEHLKELQTACETLKHLLFVAQSDTAALRESEKQINPAAKQAWISQSLNGTRGLMKKMVQTLHDAFEQYERALDKLSANDNGAATVQVDEEDQENEELEDGDGDATEALQRKLAAAKLREEQEKKFTFVFTGTSTGEKDFDLQAILKQQQPPKTAPIPSFVHELQDVLTQREAHTQPTITKEINQDPEKNSVPVIAASDEGCIEESKVLCGSGIAADCRGMKISARCLQVGRATAAMASSSSTPSRYLQFPSRSRPSACLQDPALRELKLLKPVTPHNAASISMAANGST